MAQLPPKAPTMAQKWPSSFAYHQMMPMSASQPPSWMDDFVDFASARRNSHRRSVSDPIAFVEAPFMNQSRNSNANESLIPCSNHNNNGFERFDDEQLCSMFSDDVTENLRSVTSLRTPSDHQNSDIYNDEQKSRPQQEQQPKNEPGEVEDDGDYEEETESVKPPITFSGEGGTTVVDPKRVKRILANRQSAQRSRVRKLHYISELERSVTNLQTEVSTLSPRVAFFDHQRLILNVDNSSLKQRIAALAQDKIFKDAHQEALKKEIERLRRVYHEQNMNKQQQQQPDNTTSDGSPAAMTSPPPHPAAAAAASVDGTDG